jgi:hypothetical protein
LESVSSAGTPEGGVFLVVSSNSAFSGRELKEELNIAEKFFKIYKIKTS